MDILLLMLVVGLAVWVVLLRKARNQWQRDRELAAERFEHTQTRLAAISRRRGELEAVMSSMAEGVAFVDLEERFVSLNPAAAHLLSLDPDQAVGRPIQEAVRSAPLHDLVARTLHPTAGPDLRGELTLRLSPGSSADDRFLQAHSAPVRDHDGQQVGAVIVLHDITRLRRLEAIRRDFVANVSHEIKTPISAIKAAIETLIEDPQMPAAPRQQFTGVIARQADRLDNIVEDLLSLARLEQEGTQPTKELESHELGPVIDAALESCAANAAARSITLVQSIDPVTARCVPNLLEQAVVNLVDNAIKYSPEHTEVRIAARRRGQEIILSVADRGRGIEAEHLPRVFERFYRTDRARSRALGGTGLGLSIVKHVAEVHGGRTGVESVVGQGSTFTLYLQAGDGSVAAAAASKPAATLSRVPADHQTSNL